ncbi:MAG: hypothetical protein KatS3mg011_0898 [Acidimicrobiia bacterium]|nr:MAG: hypothetical protein KatS3mg011_0898 [Acidimicrobiia bacterium]
MNRLLFVSLCAFVLAVPVRAAEPVVPIEPVVPLEHAQGPFPSGLVFPQDAAVTTFGHTFGAAKPDGRRHLGEDLFAPKGTPIYAVADGVVATLGWGPTAGYYIVVEHVDGWESWYLHLDNDTPGTDDGRGDRPFAPDLQEGDFVWAGRVIGYVGDSGNAEGTSPHTHFELHRSGRVVDPGPWLVDSFRLALEAIEAERLSQVLGSAR